MAHREVVKRRRDGDGKETKQQRQKEMTRKMRDLNNNQEGKLKSVEETTNQEMENGPNG